MNQLKNLDSFEMPLRRYRALAGLLELILRQCELSPERHERLRAHYVEKTEQLKECPWLRQYNIELKPQGSAASRLLLSRTTRG
jgi:hypothetical protein